MKLRLTLLASLCLLAAPAPAAQRHWTYLSGCASADWLGLTSGQNAEGQTTCWASQAGGVSGALPPGPGDQVFLLNDRAAFELLTPLVASSRNEPFAASAQSLVARGSAQFATGLLVQRGALNLQRLSLGSAIGEPAQRGRVVQSGGTVSVGIGEVQHGDYLLQGGRLLADSLLLHGPQPLFEQRGGSALFGQVDLLAPLNAGSAQLLHRGGSLGIERLTLKSERMDGVLVQAGPRSEAQIDQLLSLGGGASRIELGAGARWTSRAAVLAEGESGSTSLRLDSGAQWTVSTQFVLGGAGFADAELAGGAQLHTHNTWLAGGSTSVARLQLSGAGTHWQNSGELLIGRGRNGTVQLMDGATVQSAGFTLGEEAGAQGVLDLTGSGTQWTHTGRAVIGSAGQGELAVRGGAWLQGLDAVLGGQPGGAGQVEVRGAGSRWLLDGRLTLGGVGTGLLVVGSGGRVEAESLWADANGQVRLEGGSLTLRSGMQFVNGGSFVWQAGLLRLLGGDAQLGQGGLPPALSLDATRQLHVAGRLKLPAGSVLLLAGGGLQAAALDLDGGALVGDASGRLSLDDVPLLRGHGTAAVAMSGGSNRLHRIEATGTLSLGQLARRDGIDIGGELVVGSQLVALHDADLAELRGNVFMEAGGRLASLNGIHLDGGVLFSRGEARVQGAFVNDGRVASERGAIVFTDAVSGVGSFAGAVQFQAEYAPGLGAVQVDFRGGRLSFGPQASLRMELGAAQQDRLVGIDLLQLDGGLVLHFGAGLDGGARFDLFDFAQLSGQFSQVRVQGVSAARVDVSRLFIDGSVALAPVPEPSVALLWAAGLMGLVLRRRMRP